MILPNLPKKKHDLNQNDIIYISNEDISRTKRKWEDFL